MTIPKVTEVDRLIIGRYYLVPCVQPPCDIWGFRQGEWVPVLGEAHTDPELGAPFLHFHYDRRFIPPKWAIGIHSSSVIAVTFADRSQYPTPETPLVWQKKYCYTIDGSFAPESSLEAFKEALEPIYRHHRVECLKCPHRGVALNAIEPDENGAIHCPGHGLKWSANTGKMVPIELVERE